MTSLVKIRHQILRLLGTLGGQTNMLVLGNTDPSKAVTWDTNNHLTFAVPFQDMKPNIYLGKVTTLLYAQKFKCVSIFMWKFYYEA